jgi:acetyl esterase
MRTFLRVAFGVIVALALAAAVLIWTWTNTEHGPLDVGAAIVVHTMPSDGSADFSAENRARMDAWVGRFMPSPEAGVAARDATYPIEGGTQPLRIYTPEGNGPFPVVFWIHGGGFFMGGDQPIWDGACSQLAAEVPALVVSVGYRLAPESPFPAAVNDSFAALRFVAEHAAEWKGDPTRIAVMGGSAGGNLAAVVAQRARDEGGPPLVYQVLVVPATYAAGDPTESRKLFGKGYGLDGIPEMVANYIPNEADRANPWASPLLASSFAGLPPALVLTAEFDPLRDEGEAYAEKLRSAGVQVTVKRYPGAIHGFLGSSDDAAAADALSAEKLRQAFTTD